MSTILPTIDQHTRLYELVQFWQHKTPYAHAVIFEDQFLTYKDFAQQIELCAKKLLSQGVTQGDVVALFAQPSIVFAVHIFACARIGAIWLGLNPKYSATELDYIVNNAAPKSIWLETTSILNADPQVIAYFASQNNVWTCHSKVINDRPKLAVLGYMPNNARLGTTGLATILNTVQLPCLSTIDAKAAAVLIYTSGTTGTPKGAVISQYALAKASIIQANLLDLTSPSILNNLPINHIGSVGDITTSMIASGGCVVMQSKFDVSEGFKLIQQHSITIWGQIPTMFQIALEHDDFADADLSSLQCILFSGAPASLDLVRKLQQICVNVINAYGMSETVGSVTWALDESDTTLANTIGRALPSVQLRLADENDKAVTMGEKGEIQVKSDYCFSYYWRDQKSSQEAFSLDGYLKTGDLGQQNSDGTIKLVGRTKERFKSGGYNVYPREIEHVISHYPKVLDAVVVAVPDPLYFEVGFAFVIAKPLENCSKSELKQHCQTLLANFKIPKYFEFITEFPQLANGKINKKALANMAAEQVSESMNDTLAK
jgi:acyl-CoA synthetase (AMP-forming)/AMP-acid ligase II